MKSQSNLAFSSVTRREAIRTTLLFAGGILSAPTRAFARQEDAPGGGIHLLAFGDFGTNNAPQRKVAESMNTYAGKIGTPLHSILALGDNFYGMLTPERFRSGFEEMYSKEHLDCPFHAVLGNHDYGPQYDSDQGRAKADMQIEYSRNNPTSRFKMPAKWYALELGDPGKPLVKVIFLDGNTFEGALTPKEKIEQKRWLDRELAKPTDAKWLWMVSHYPMFSDTEKRGDGLSYIKSWGGYLKDHPVSVYLAGHDHNLQHLRAEGYGTDFLVSGGGGAHGYEIVETGRGFTKATCGFNHLHVTDDKLTVRLLDDEGAVMHAFERNAAGDTKVLKI